MEPTNFPEANKTLSAPAGMANCEPLRVWTDGRMTVSCWRPSWRERLSILFFGRAWLCVHFGETQPPVWIDGRRSVFEKAKT